jgi:hypothetical protein
MNDGLLGALHPGQPGFEVDVLGIYHPRHLERTALYRVIFHYFERFVTE